MAVLRFSFKQVYTACLIIDYFLSGALLKDCKHVGCQTSVLLICMLPKEGSIYSRPSVRHLVRYITLKLLM